MRVPISIIAVVAAVASLSACQALSGSMPPAAIVTSSVQDSISSVQVRTLLEEIAKREGTNLTGRFEITPSTAHHLSD